MTVSRYQQITPAKDSSLCGFCRHPLDNGEKIVAHNNGGELHPVHEGCLLVSGRWKSICYICKKNTTSHSLLNTSSRIKLMAKEFFLCFLFFSLFVGLKDGFNDGLEATVVIGGITSLVVVTIRELERYGVLSDSRGSGPTRTH